ncbi:MAG: ATP-binding cassette domain-containing protein, partial [Paracoccaceae bacterium]
EGRIILAGRDITALPPHKRRVGLLFQDDVLFPHLSVGANLAFALPPAVKGRMARRAMVDAALDQADLSGFASRDPATLSGGQRARVALMRTLLAQPCALLLDEPFSRLDAGLRAQIRSFVLSRVRDKGLPAVLVTHDAEDARAAGGRVVTPLGLPVTL